MNKLVEPFRRCSIVCPGEVNQDVAEQKERSRRIDKDLRMELKRRQRCVKLLLLGPAESGKSTFLKQMRIINSMAPEHQTVFSAAELSEHRRTVYVNIIRGMQALIVGQKQLGIPFAQPELEPEAEKVSPSPKKANLFLCTGWVKVRDSSVSVNEIHKQVLLFDSFSLVDIHNFFDLRDLYADLWGDPAIKETFRRRAELKLQVVDSVAYFLGNLDRVADRRYAPTLQDILHARKTTKSVVEYSVPVDGVDFHFMDFGGQRAQRHKWFYTLFSSEVTAILFVASASEFDQRLRECWEENRLAESVYIFDMVANNIHFSSIPVVLFLNKMDLLQEKVCGGCPANIASHFPAFNSSHQAKHISACVRGNFGGDPTDIDDVKMFILYLFLSKTLPLPATSVRVGVGEDPPTCRPEGPSSGTRRPRGRIYHHFTMATDTNNIRRVFSSVKDHVLRRNLDALNLE